MKKSIFDWLTFYQEDPRNSESTLAERNIFLRTLRGKVKSTECRGPVSKQFVVTGSSQQGADDRFSQLGAEDRISQLGAEDMFWSTTV